MSDLWRALNAYCAHVEWNQRSSKSLSLPTLRECHLHCSHSRFLLWCVQPFEKHSPWSSDHVLTRCSCKFIFVPLFTLGSWYKKKKKKKKKLTKLKKSKRSFSTLLRLYWTKEWEDSFFPQDERATIRSLCHLIWRPRPALLSFVFLSLQHNRVCLAVSTLSM